MFDWRPVGMALLMMLAVGMPADGQRPAPAETEKPIAVRVEDPAGKGEFVVFVDGVRLQLPALLEKLGRQSQKRGRNTLVVVMISQKQPLGHVEYIRGVIDKVGFGNVRYFHYGPDRRMMAELLFGKAIPFSEAPAAKDFRAPPSP